MLSQLPESDIHPDLVASLEFSTGGIQAAFGCCAGLFHLLLRQSPCTRRLATIQALLRWILLAHQLVVDHTAKTCVAQNPGGWRFVSCEETPA